MSASTPVIAIEDIRFRWQDDQADVLTIDTLTIKQGDRVFIAGASGSGKSTLLSLLAGVNIVRRGQVRLLDQPLEALSQVGRDQFRADHIGYIFQMFNLIPYLSIVDNVLLPCRFSQRRRDQALQNSATLEKEALRLLTHLDLEDAARRQRPVTDLSVGQQQRVAAARALIGAPELLIADEPTSALDHDRRQAFIDLLFQECGRSGSTLVFVSHDRSLQDLFDSTIELADINRPAPEIQP